MRCRRCGFTSPAGFRFCGGCGAPIEGDASPPRVERKLVTALFCDLAGFTHRAERLDPEDVHRFLTPYFARARAELERFGGTVEKFIGDAVMALFGAPSAHGDDPERAVRAALAVRDEIASLNESEPELDLHVHIGIATGEALVAVDAVPLEGEGMAWGDTVNTAARIQASAPVDGILVDGATYRATRDAVDYATAEPVRGKGKGAPIPVWRAVAPRSRRGLDLAEGAPTPLVARDAELGLLVDVLSSVRRQRSPAFVDVIGPPGIGKSRLVFELFRSVEEGKPLITWRHGRCPQHRHGVAYWALGEVVKGQAGILDSDDAGTAARKLAAAVETLVPGADGARIEAHLRPLVGLSDEGAVSADDRGAAFAAWREFLEALARQRPLVLVLEDLHWADDGLLDFVEHLRERAAGVPLLFVGTARPELLDLRPEWGRGGAVTLALTRLSDADTGRLVSLLAAGQELDAELRDAVVARAAGNPLYAVEYLRMVSDRGLAAAFTAGLPLPESVQGIIAARLDMLPPDEKELLQEAAVVGKLLWPGALAAVGGRSRAEVGRGLRALERKEFVAPTGRSSVEREDEYRFRHVLVRDVAYGQIPRARRAELHGRVAEWLESLSPDRAVDRAEMLARHYLRALELGRASGGATPDLVDRTRSALCTAGDRALALHAFPHASRFYRQAIELWPEEDTSRPAVLFRLGKARFYAESAGGDELEEARDALLRADEPALAAEAESLLGLLAHHRGDQAAALAHVEHAAELVTSVDPSRATADVLLDQAGILVLANESRRAIAVAREAHAIGAALELPRVEARALSLVGWARAQLGDLGGVADLERAVEVAEAVGAPESVFARGTLADIACSEGDLSRCFDLQARAMRQAERFGYDGFVRWMAAERVGEWYWRGRWSDAVAAADTFIGEAEAGRPHFMESYCRDMRARIRLARGDVDGALADAVAALAFARDAKDLQVLYPALACGARVLAAAGRTGEADGVADELLSLWRSRLDVLLVGAWIADLADALGLLGRSTELDRAASSIATRTGWLEAATAFAGGEFGRAADVFSAIGSRPDEALARLRAGRSLVEAGREAFGRRELESAASFFRGVDAAAYVEEAETLLVGAGGL